MLNITVYLFILMNPNQLTSSWVQLGSFDSNTACVKAVRELKAAAPQREFAWTCSEKK